MNILPFGINDNFFEAGGDSLLVMRVTALIRETIQEEVPLRAVFETPTVATLTERLRGAETFPGRLGKVATIVKQLQNMTESGAEAMLVREADGGNG